MSNPLLDSLPQAAPSFTVDLAPTEHAQEFHSESAPKSPFSEIVPHWQVAWDSTSIGWFKTCPRKYYYYMIEGWSPRSKGHHLVFGLLYAGGVERYAHHRAAGMSHEESSRAVVRWALEQTWDRSIGAAWESNDQYKNRYTLIRSLVWNFEDRLTSPFKTVTLANGKPAVELSFNFTIFELEGEQVSYCGHLDEVVEAEGELFVKDDKTTKSPLDARYFSQWTPNTQMSGYTVAGSVIFDRPIRGVIVRAAQIGVGFTRFATQQVTRTKPILDEWLADTRLYIQRAREYAERDYWPMNDTACQNYGGCPLQKVCAVSPSHRAAWLENDFERRPWNPLSPRGDI